MLDELTSVEAEITLIASIVQAGEMAFAQMSLLDSTDFYLTEHQEIFAAARAQSTDNLSIDMIGICDRLKVMEATADIGTVRRFMDEFVVGHALNESIRIVRDRSARRKCYIALQHACSDLSDLTIPPEQALQQVFSAAPRNEKQLVTTLGETIAQVYEQAEIRQTTQVVPGHSTGFVDIDKKMRVNDGLLMYLGGRPSMGKTSLALQLCENVAEQGGGVAFFSLEMTAQQLAERILLRHSMVERHIFTSGRITDTEWFRISEVLPRLSGMPFVLYDVPTLSLADIRGHLQQYSRVSKVPLKLVAIDYFQLMDGPGEGVHKFTPISVGLKRLAKEFNCCFLVLSQLSRALESRTDKRPRMSDFRETGSLEQDADLMLAIYRDEYYDPGTVDRGLAEVLLLKNRMGPTGTVKLLFENRFTNFRSLLVTSQ